MRSDSAAIACIDSSRCFASPEMLTTPTRDRCQILMIELGDGHVEMRAQPIFQAAQHLPLILQRLRIRDVDFQCEETDRHFRASRGSEEA